VCCYIDIECEVAVFRLLLLLLILPRTTHPIEHAPHVSHVGHILYKEIPRLNEEDYCFCGFGCHKKAKGEW